MTKMKMAERLALMAARGATVGGGAYVDAETIAEAEEYVSRYPLDGHGFATSAAIDVPSVDVAREMLAEAGYLWDGPACTRNNFRARISESRDKAAVVWIGPSEGMTAMATGPGGYLPPGDRPEA